MGIAINLETMLARGAEEVLIAKARADDRALQGAVNLPQSKASRAHRRRALEGTVGEREYLPRWRQQRIWHWSVLQCRGFKSPGIGRQDMKYSIHKKSSLMCSPQPRTRHWRGR